MEILKKDWKLYQVKLAKWQENYIEHLNQEYITLLSDKEKIPSEKFWELEKRIKKDRQHPGVIIDVQKSTAIWNIIDLIKMQVMSIRSLLCNLQETQRAGLRGRTQHEI